MENENGAVDNSTVEDTSVDYISAINEIKENSVSKETYKKVVDENKRLLESLINGNQIEVDQKDEASIDDLRKKLFSSRNQNLSNLEYVETALKLRKKLIEAGEVDPFVPFGEKIKPTDEDFIKADKVAAVLQECVDYAEGNPDTFTDALARSIN